MDMKFFIIV